MRKAGPPEAGSARRITAAESVVVGCPRNWWITLSYDGRAVLLRSSTKSWVRLVDGGVLAVSWSDAVDMPEAAAARVNAKLRAFWRRQRAGRQMSMAELSRTAQAARDALRGRINRAELEWVASLDE